MDLLSAAQLKLWLARACYGLSALFGSASAVRLLA
jgi:hypothetical protein